MIRVLFDMNRIFNFYRIFKFSSSQWYIDGITRYTLSLLKAMQEMDIFHIEYVVYENISDNIHKFEALFKFEALLKNETSLPAYNTLFLRDKKIQNPDMEAALKQAHIYFIPYLCHELDYINRHPLLRFFFH